MEYVILKREVFADLLSDFSTEVQAKRCKKLNYDLWRPLYLWSKPESQYSNIRIKKCGCFFEIRPDDVNLLLPNAVRIDVAKDPDFYHYLDDEYAFHTEYAATKLANDTSCSNQVVDCVYDGTSFGVSNYYWDNYGLTIGNDFATSATVELNTDYLKFDGESLEEVIRKTLATMNNDESTKEKEKKNIMTFGNFDFGPVDSSIHMSMYGMAVKNASGTYVSYDVENKQIIDVDILNFEGANKFLYKIPVAINEIAVGDIVVHARKPMFVVAVRKDDKLAVVDPIAGEEKVIMLTRSPFGFNFATKVVSFLNFGSANANAPFGNMLPFFLLNDNKNTDDILPLMFMMNGQNAMATNPMLMYALLSKDNKAKDMLPFLLMMSANPMQPTGCSGNCHCHEQAE